MADCQQAPENTSDSPENLLDKEVGNARLAYRQPPTPKDGNFLFHAMHDQLVRLGRVSESATTLRCDLVNYLRSNPATPDERYLSEFIYLGVWDTYLRRMAMDGEWGYWVALWGLINILQIPVAIVSSLEETGLKVVYPADFQNEAQATGDKALLGHEAELHYHSLEPMASQNPQLATSEELKQRYDQGKITEEICPKCGRKFECYSQAIFESGGVLQYYSDR